MIYLGNNSRKNNKIKLFLNIEILAYQKPDKIYKIKKFNTLFTKFQ